jgi:hypothetical protein
MSSHNAKPEFSIYKTPVADDAAVEEARVISSKLVSDADLMIDDEFDHGCDPYNATGQHVILKQKKSPKK